MIYVLDQWMIGMGGEWESGKSMLIAQLDDDDDNDMLLSNSFTRTRCDMRSIFE